MSGCGKNRASQGVSKAGRAAKKKAGVISTPAFETIYKQEQPKVGTSFYKQSIICH
jgi:hypothetical protein